MNHVSEKIDKLIFKSIRYLTFLGNIFPQFLICMFICFFLNFEKGYYITGLWGWSYFLNIIIKNTVRKPRPDHNGHRIKVKGFSFPSGHSLTSTVLYFSIAKYLGIAFPLNLVFYALPFLLGLTRLYLRVHYVEDVIGGWVIGYLYLCFLEDFVNKFHSLFLSQIMSTFGTL